MKSRTSFDLNAGRLVFNFTNTVEERPGYHTNNPASPIELLDCPERVVAWCEASGAIGREVLSRMHSEWRRNPKGAALGHKRLIALREGLFALFWGLIHKGALRERDIEFLNSELIKLPPQIVVKDAKGSCTLRWRDDGDAEQLLIAAIVSDASQLITSNLLERVRVCAAKDCGWLFLDTSKNGKRRWCDMADCGNREKQKRFQMSDRS